VTCSGRRYNNKTVSKYKGRKCDTCCSVQIREVELIDVDYLLAQNAQTCMCPCCRSLLKVRISCIHMYLMSLSDLRHRELAVGIRSISLLW
jgi:hypothetical protein